MKIFIKNNDCGSWDLVNEFVLANQKFIASYMDAPVVIVKLGQKFEVRGELSIQDIGALLRFNQIPLHNSLGPQIREPETVKIVKGKTNILHQIKTGENWVKKNSR